MTTYLKSLAHVWSVISLPNTQPSPRVNTVFSRLVSTVIEVPMLHKYLGATRASCRLHRVCAQGEFALEMTWARYISQANHPRVALREFPYWNNYECLTAREHQLIAKHRPKAKQIVFLGSGPLPLTAILLAERYGYEVTLVDQDVEAIAVSRKLIESLGLGDSLRAVHGNAETYAGIEDADVVFVAALVGQSGAEQSTIYSHLAKAMRKEASLLIRSAHSSRTMLYRPVSNLIDSYFSRLAEMHPHDDVINSVILLRPYA